VLDIFRTVFIFWLSERLRKQETAEGEEEMLLSLLRIFEWSSVLVARQREFRQP